jgi:predicted nucleotide-binding protein (sugar kinase/HSP70/actin superfamily)
MRSQPSMPDVQLLYDSPNFIKQVMEPLGVKVRTSPLTSSKILSQGQAALSVARFELDLFVRLKRTILFFAAC